MPRGRKKTIDAVEVGQPDPIEVSEIGNQGPIERVSENDFVDVANLEAFMNEPVQVMVHSDPRTGSIPVITVTVNGVNQCFIRNQAQTVKRKYVEALARGTTTVYEQVANDASNPHRRQMVPKKAPEYPFAVRGDNNPNGFPWLESILAEKG